MILWKISKILLSIFHKQKGTLRFENLVDVIPDFAGISYDNTSPIRKITRKTNILMGPTAQSKTNPLEILNHRYELLKFLLHEKLDFEQSNLDLQI